MLEKVSKSNKTGTVAKVPEILDSAKSEVTKMQKLAVPLHLQHEQNQLPKCMVIRAQRNYCSPALKGIATF